MQFRKEIWKSDDYQSYLSYLNQIKEENYATFQKKIIFTKYPILGIRAFQMRKIAKEILKGNALSFLNLCQSTYYEEVMIEGFVIAGLEEKDFEKYFFPFLFQIDNWAICDSFCNSVKVFSIQKEKYWPIIEDLLKRKEEFGIRVGLILLLNFYLEKPYLSKILFLINQIDSQEYYVEMAIAWLVSEIYIRYPKIGLSFLKKNQLSKFSQNKAISKVCDSYRVSIKEKELVKKYRK